MTLVLLLTVLLAVLVYANSLSGPFIFDDGASIRDNPTIRSLRLSQALSPPNHARTSRRRCRRPAIRRG